MQEHIFCIIVTGFHIFYTDFSVLLTRSFPVPSFPRVFYPHVSLSFPLDLHKKTC
ncbi:hypothetical protein GCWU000342_01460 [Shuttleworthella satelles DSM 14600]|uniref:Uncharacterized protein n=1 Tax=Shuttleworthella satelles DSM 14600 TaxID=626523 RepID=C4GAB5_9FIRM|nr:hypothetical protein GCWU000342_01460 [Shuttleworthia satelles DSM 14600]